jgi:membrane protease subunit HflC
MRRWLVAVGVLLVAAYVASTSFVAVDETEVVVITQFGRPVRVAEKSGLTLKLPDPVQTALRLDRRLQTLDTHQREYLTQDKKNVVLRGVVVWRVGDPGRFIQSVRDVAMAELRLSDLVASELGAAVGTYPLASFLNTEDGGTRLGEMATRVEEACRRQARAEFGLEVLVVRVRRFGFPEQNLQSVYSRMRAERERMAKKYRAEGEEEASKIRTQTERAVRELLANAYREAQVVRGQGEADATRTYGEAHRQDPAFYSLSRTLQAYQKLIDENTTLILSSDAPLFRHIETPPEAR